MLRDHTLLGLKDGLPKRIQLRKQRKLTDLEKQMVAAKQLLQPIA
jgi:hypothetical protein